MLWFEREVVGALVTSSRPPVRSAVEAFVDGTLRDMAEWMRAGLAAESLLLGAYVAVLRTRRPLDGQGLRELLGRWETSRIGPLAQYVRAMRSLVLFAENELAAPDGGGEVPGAGLPSPAAHVPASDPDTAAGPNAGTGHTPAEARPATSQPGGTA